MLFYTTEEIKIDDDEAKQEDAQKAAPAPVQPQGKRKQCLPLQSKSHNLSKQAVTIVILNCNYCSIPREICRCLVYFCLFNSSDKLFLERRNKGEPHHDL